ncbi:MAG TPA: DUF1385 domain-containing protein [Bryobacteraceae bacterium]|nr:DUF1385 domain-containing protein [Bryobacteraceae bacterium]
MPSFVSPRTLLRLFTHFQMLPILESGEETLVGGQAVLEGVMMRAPHSYCVAVRQADGNLVTEELPIERMSEKHKVFKYPIMRGLGTLYQAMLLGGKALRFSASAAMEEADGSPAPKASAKKKKPEPIPGWAFLAPLLFSLAFFLFAYKFVPLFVATQLGKVWPVLSARIPFNLTDGLVRLGILLVLLYSVSRFKDIHRTFEYHGAEHKVVFNFESGQPVNVANAQRFSTFHPRCGTSFLFVLFFLAIPVYALIPFDGFLAKLLSRIALLPLLIGASYELIRFAAKRRGSLLAALTAPGLWMQRITTQPPSGDQTAVAIHALEGAMALEKSQGGELVIA